MIRCDNQRCKHNHREICVNMHLQIESERCICFEPKWQKKRKNERNRYKPYACLPLDKKTYV
nr:MAG TPA: hypothetical protein [Caudoviricetes sp.]